MYLQQSVYSISIKSYVYPYPMSTPIPDIFQCPMSIRMRYHPSYSDSRTIYPTISISISRYFSGTYPYSYIHTRIHIQYLSMSNARRSHGEAQRCLPGIILGEGCVYTVPSCASWVWYWLVLCWSVLWVPPPPLDRFIAKTNPTLCNSKYGSPKETVCSAWYVVKGFLFTIERKPTEK